MNDASRAGRSDSPGWDTIYDHPDKVQSKYTVVDGYRTHYLTCGPEHGKPLVLVHGGNFQTGLASERWFPNIVPLGNHFRVFAADQLGGGQTDAPRDIRDLGHVRVRADHILAFIEALNLGPVHLLGQSQGSWIATYIALKRPDLVDRLILVDTASVALPAGGMGGPNIASKFTEASLPGTMVRKHIDPTAEGIREWLVAYTYDVSILPDAFLERSAELARKWLPIWDEPWRQFWADGGARNKEQYLVDGTHISELVHTLPQGPLIIWGKNSVKGLDNGVSLFKRIPDAQFHVFDKADHLLWIDQWADFNSLSTWFLTRGR